MDRWTDLALRARDGDRSALEEFIAISQVEVQTLCRHLGGRDTAEDLAQEVYYRAIRSLPRYEGHGSARHWLLRIARNTCADMTRQRIRRRRFLAATEPPEVGVESVGWAEELELVDSLSPERREAFVLTQFLGLPYAETAAVIGIPIGTVRSRVARARADLLDQLEPSDAHDEGDDLSGSQGRRADNG